MWFRHDNYGGFYYLTTPEEAGNDRPLLLSAQAPERAPEDDDRTWDFFMVQSPGGAVAYRWVLNPNANVVAAATIKKEFPKLVTPQTLADFFKSDPKKSTAIALDSHTTIARSKDFSSFTLSCKGQRLVWWGGDTMNWYLQGNAQQEQVDALNKYLGKTWRIAAKDDMIGLVSDTEKWIPASPYLEFSPRGTIQGREKYEKQFTESWLKEYGRLVASVDQYTASLTPKKIADATEGMTSKTHTILTRCEGCQTCNGAHLDVHMARKELDAYLIYSAYDSVDAAAINKTWRLIESPNVLAVAEFQSIIRRFLLNLLRSRIQGPCYLPMNLREGRNPWRLGGNGRMYVEEGQRLVLAGRQRDGEEPPLAREGEWIARERQQAEVEIRPARVNAFDGFAADPAEVFIPRPAREGEVFRDAVARLRNEPRVEPAWDAPLEPVFLEEEEV